MLDKNMHQADFNISKIRHLAYDFIGDDMKAPGTGFKGKRFLQPHNFTVDFV